MAIAMPIASFVVFPTSAVVKLVKAHTTSSNSETYFDSWLSIKTPRTFIIEAKRCDSSSPTRSIKLASKFTKRA